MKKYPIERVEKTLENGMRVVLIHKPDFIRSLFMIGVPAGGNNVLEQCGETRIQRPSGCAHFLEHKMFRLNGEDVTYPLAAMRAQTNAFTTYTETCYYISTNADPKGPLGLLIDFVQNLDIDEESVDREKGIILSEYRQYAQDPDMRLLQESFRGMYSKHPLKTDILGTEEEISAMSVEDLESFYQAWYDPAQLVLCGITGRDPHEVLSWIEEKEKQYPSRVSALSRRVIEPEPAEPAHPEISIEMDVDTCYASLAIKLQPVEDPVQAVRRDWLLNIWLGGIFGTLNPDFQTWIDQRVIASGMAAEADLSQDHGYVLIVSQTNRPHAFFKTVEEQLDAKRPLDAQTFENLKIRMTASALRVLEQFDTLASEHIRGSFEGFDPLRDPEILSSITLKEVTEFIRGLDFSSRSKILIHPAGWSGDEKAPDSFDENALEAAGETLRLQEEMTAEDEESAE